MDKCPAPRVESSPQTVVIEGGCNAPRRCHGRPATSQSNSLCRIVPLQSELRLGIALSLLGAPFFLGLLLRMRKGLA